jgi:hypothetical protein
MANAPRPSARLDPRLRLLSDTLDRATLGRGWHGPTLLGALRGVDASVAAWTPPHGGHGIWELALHAAYWMYAIRRQIDRGSPEFGRSPSNWPRVPRDLPERELARAWKGDVALVKAEHARLREAVLGVNPALLDRVPPGLKGWTLAQRVIGAAEHNAYHAGQISLLKGLAEAAGAGR